MAGTARLAASGAATEAAIAAVVLSTCAAVVALLARSAQFGTPDTTSMPWQALAVAGAGLLAWRATRRGAGDVQRAAALGALGLWQALPASVAILSADDGRIPSGTAPALSVAVCGALLLPLAVAGAGLRAGLTARQAAVAGTWAAVAGSWVVLPGQQPAGVLAAGLLVAAWAGLPGHRAFPPRLRASRVLLAASAATALAGSTASPSATLAGTVAWILLAALTGVLAGRALPAVAAGACVAACALAVAAGLFHASGSAALLPRQANAGPVPAGQAELEELAAWLGAQQGDAGVIADLVTAARLDGTEGLTTQVADGPLRALLLRHYDREAARQLSRLDGQWVVVDRRTGTVPNAGHWFAPGEPAPRRNPDHPLADCVPALVQAYSSLTYAVYRVDGTRGMPGPQEIAQCVR